MQTGIVPDGAVLPGKDKGDGTLDKPGTDVKSTDTKPTDTKSPAAPVKEDKPQQATTPKTAKPEKAVTGKDAKPSKATAEKQISKGTKKLTGSKTATAHKTTKSAAAKTKEKKAEDKVQVHIEFFSTKSGGGGFNSGGYGR